MDEIQNLLSAKGIKALQASSLYGSGLVDEFSLYTGIIAACVSPLAFMMCRKWLMVVILPVSIIAAAVSIYAAV